MLTFWHKQHDLKEEFKIARENFANIQILNMQDMITRTTCVIVILPWFFSCLYNANIWKDSQNINKIMN